MSDSPIRILHVGAGVRGRHWLDFVQGSSMATSVGCVEPDPKTLAGVQQGFAGLATFASLEEGLGAVEADAALIASPSAYHAEQAIAALEAGLAVMIEKPFAPSVDEARRVIEAGERAGKPVMVAEQFRYVPAERTIRAAVQSGRLGNVSNVVFTDRRRMPLEMHGPWVKDIEYPQLSEIAVHHFDSLLSFFEKRPVSIAARAWNPEGSDYAKNACTEALVELEDGIHVQYLGLLTSNKFGYQVRIEGDGGDLWTNRKHVLVRPKGKKLFLPAKKASVLPGDEKPYPMEGMASLMASLRDAVRDGKEPETAGRHNVWAVALVHAGILSDRERRTVMLDEIYSEGR